MRVAAHLYQSPMVGESRIERIVDTLLDEGLLTHVYLVGTRRAGLPDTEVLRLGKEVLRLGPVLGQKRSLIGKVVGTLRWALDVWRALRGKHLDFVNCHAVTLLPLCVLLARRHRAALIYDTHELETETYYCRGIRKIALKILERLLIARAAHTFVVGPRIANWYRQHYGIVPTVIRNMPIRAAETPTAGQLRHRLGIPAETLVYLYLGRLVTGRGIEKCLDIFARTPEQHIVFMGEGPLAPSISAAHARHPNIHHHPAVLPSAVIAEARAADVGVFISSPSCLSYEYSCPNKFFEYLQSGLPAMVTDNFVEQADIIRAHGAGWVVPQDPEQAAGVIRSIDRSQVRAAQSRAEACAPNFHWAHDRAVLVETYRTLLARTVPLERHG